MLSFGLFICALYYCIIRSHFRQNKKKRKKEISTRFTVAFDDDDEKTRKRTTTTTTVEFQLSWNGSYIGNLFDVTNTNGFIALMKNCCFLVVNTSKIYASAILCALFLFPFNCMPLFALVLFTNLRRECKHNEKKGT